MSWIRVISSVHIGKAGEVRESGTGIVVWGTDMLAPDLGLTVTGRLRHLPFAEYNPLRGPLTEENFLWMLESPTSSLQATRGGQRQSIFDLDTRLWTPEERTIAAATRELVEVGFREPVRSTTLRNLKLT